MIRDRCAACFFPLGKSRVEGHEEGLFFCNHICELNYLAKEPGNIIPAHTCMQPIAATEDPA